MADEEERAEESRQEPDDKFHQERDAEQAERARLAENVGEVPQPREER